MEKRKLSTPEKGQHSGYGYKCQGCKKKYSARRDRGIRDVNTLMGRMSYWLIEEVAELAYQEFRATVLNQPRPAKTGTQKRSTSEPRSNRPLKKARTMSVASMPVTSPVARVQPPPPPRFNQAPLRMIMWLLEPSKIQLQGV